MNNRAVRERLLASTIIAGALIAASPAFAQQTPDAGGNVTPAPSQTGQTTTPSGEQTQASAGPTQPSSSGEIVVTGSLIKNPSLTSTAPVQVLGQEELQLRQTNTAEEVLRDIPGAVADVGSAVNNGNGGGSFVDLRGLGSNRNLVLLDGNRLVPFNLSGVTDLNTIPLALIQRTEVLTGGASTTYGADAVSGVVNFITRSDFSGVEATVSKQLTQQGDGAYYRADITVGANFDDGRGNVVFSVGYQHSDPVYQGDRNFSRASIDSFSGGAGGSGTTVPSRFGAIPGLGTLQINPSTGTLVPSFSAPGLARFNFNPYNIFQTPFQRYNIYGAGHYDVSDDITVYTRGMFSKNTIDTIIAPSGAFSASVVIPYSNPYLPAGAASQIGAANGLTAAQIAAARAATSTSDPNYRTFTTTLSRRAVENGPRISDYTTQTFDYRAGIRGNISSHLHFDVNGSYGETSQVQTIEGYTLNSRFKDALLATNTSTCLSGNAGCVPVNVFGPAGSITAAQAAYLSSNSFTFTRVSLGQVRGTISGDVGVHSPFATDAINFAVGVEYRKYRASQDADAISKAIPSDLGGAGSATVPFAGGYDVTEGFGEVIAPIVQDRPFMESLELNGGIRYSHYNIESNPSRSFNTTTYKGGATYKPVDALTLRGVYQHAVRAPNVDELFRPTNIGLTSLSVDPCQGQLPVNNANLAAVCVAQGAPRSAIGLIDAPSASQVNATSGGNVNLRPEKSDSYTAGIVLQPKRIVPGLSITADYYHIKITNAVSLPSANDVLNGCFGNITAASAASAACTIIRRDPNTGDLSGDNVPGVPLTLTNSGRYLTDGVDLGANYRRDLGFAILNMSFEGNWTHRSIFQSIPSSVARECVGYYSANCGVAYYISGGNGGGSPLPKFYWNQRTTLTYHDVDLSLLWRHINHLRQEPLDVTQGNGPAFTGFGTIPAYNYLDLATRIGVGEHVEFTVTVQNLLNKKPPIVGTGVGTTAFNSGNTYPSSYDALGRRFGVQARVKF